MSSQKQESMFTNIQQRFMEFLNDGADDVFAPLEERERSLDRRKGHLDKRANELSQKESNLDRREKSLVAREDALQRMAGQLEKKLDQHESNVRDFQATYSDFRSSFRDFDEQVRGLVAPEDAEGSRVVVLDDARSGQLFSKESKAKFIEGDDLCPRERQVYAFIQNYCDENKTHGVCDLTNRELHRMMDYTIPEGTITSVICTLNKEGVLASNKVVIDGKRRREVVLNYRLRNPEQFIESARNSA